MTKWVYEFGTEMRQRGPVMDKQALKNLLGGKGAGLAEMADLGLAVPPGLTITTPVCTYYYAHEGRYPEDLKAQVTAALNAVETQAQARFGDEKTPLLVSVRSGARVSMPGMMDTVLNLGLNDQTVVGLAVLSGDARFAYDSYRRFIQMYGNVVLGVEHYHFEDLLELYKEERGYLDDTELQVDDLKALVLQFKKKVRAKTSADFPTDVHAQLWGAIGAVFKSWQIDRAKTYRRLNQIPEEWGTAVNVQAMVFGNMGESSATGVAFTRDPATGEKAYYGEYLINAQGEDVVAGIRTPQALTKSARLKGGSLLPSMEESLPDVFKDLSAVFDKLEAHYKDMQDIEFTVQRGRLWILQTRSGKRTAKAALRIAVEMVKEGLIDEKTAITRVEARALDQLLHPSLDPKAPRDLLTKGLPASPGAASGQVCFTADEAERLAANGLDVILCRLETSPEDIHGMHAARGILTARGGMTSHAAVVARGMGRPCVSGAGQVRISLEAQVMTILGRSVRAGDIVTIDGATGEVFLGAVAMQKPEMAGDFAQLMLWADRQRRMAIRTNADTPQDAKIAREFGAEGIGLCRTEHMFFDGDRILAVREMILAENTAGREQALAKLLPMQRGDFVGIFQAMRGLPVTIRLLDPPLHEFLPHGDADFAAVAKAMGAREADLRERSEALSEFNPMLGHRGCRLAISYPEIYAMQARAIFEAALFVAAETGEKIVPEIMIPLVATEKELAVLRRLIDDTAMTVFAEKAQKLAYLVGTMIELPRAALMAGDIARRADFFSFGTNDLTQTTLGISRDDAGRFLEDYVRKGIFKIDPFVSIDEEGVGQLMQLGTERGRATKADLKVGICGEHGGDPKSIAFCESLQLDYVSCSPYRVPIARLAAAQAALAAAQAALAKA